MDLGFYVRLLRRRWLLVAVATVVGCMVALVATSQTQEQYKSNVRLFVNIPASRGVQEALQGVQLSSQLIASYAEVATSRAAAERIAQELDTPMSPGSVRSKLSASSAAQTLLITITATDEIPAVAQQLASVAADVFVELVGELEGRADGVRPIVIDGAQLPGTPTEPKPRRDLALGGLGGLFAGLGLGFVLETIDRSVRSTAQLSTIMGVPSLAAVPRRRDVDLAPLLAEGDAGAVTAEAYRVLRTAVRFVQLDRPMRSILVTSPSPGEGKSLTAANLAIAIARGGEKVILVDADLRRSRLPAMFDEEASPGLTSVVLGDVELEAALVDAGPRLWLLPPGELPPNSSELLGSSRCAEVIDMLVDLADVVVFDGPPVLPATDAQVLATQVDGVVVIARFGKTDEGPLAEARRRLEVVGAHLLGAVLNAVPPSSEYVEEYRYAPRGSRVPGLRGRRG